MRSCLRGSWRIKHKNKAISNRKGNDIALFLFRVHLREHILNKDAVAAGGVRDHHVGDRANELAILDDGGAAQVCGQ